MIFEKFNKLYLKYLRKHNEIAYWRKQGVFIGNGTKLYNVKFDVGHPWLISIGDDCILTNCRILTHDASTYKLLGKSVVAKVSIGNNVFIGMDSIILCGVKIGNNAIVGAGSIVTKDVEENTVVAGNPAHVITTREQFDAKYKQAFEFHPVWETYYTKKTKEEIDDMKDRLSDTFGFDA